MSLLVQVHFRAQPGMAGGGSLKSGRGGGDSFVRLPPGTLVRKAGAKDSDPPVAELVEVGERRFPLYDLQSIGKLRLLTVFMLHQSNYSIRYVHSQRTDEHAAVCHCGHVIHVEAATRR
jgi:hypothetical protein